MRLAAETPPKAGACLALGGSPSSMPYLWAGGARWGKERRQAPRRLEAGSGMAAGTPELLVAITGASGSAYGVRLVARTCALVEEVHLIVSRHGAQVLAHELGAPFDLARP